MRERRRCSACGVGLPADAARCPTCGHAEGDRIVIEDHHGSPGSWPVLVALVIVLGIVGVLVAVDRRSSSDDDGRDAARGETTTTEPDTSTSRRRDSTTTPPPRSFEPTLPLGHGQRLVGVVPGWLEVLDPATGMITSTRLGSGVDFLTVLPRLGGAVVVGSNSLGAEWFPELPTDEVPRPLGGEAFEAFPSDLSSRVWIPQGLPNAAVEEIEVTTGDVVDRVKLPAAAHAVGSIDGGLVVRAPGGLFAYRRTDDRFEPIADGEFVASRGRFVAYQSCDDRLVCPIVVRDLVAGATAEMEAPPSGLVIDAAISPDGGWLAVVLQVEEEDQWRIVVHAVASGRASQVSAGSLRELAVGPVPFSQLAWSPDSQWLVWAEFPGIRGFHPDDGTAAFIDCHGADYRGIAVLDAPATAGG